MDRNEIARIKQEKEKQLLDTINDNINQVTINPRVSEKIFVKVFLPVFLADEENNIYNANISTWVNKVSGNPFTEVDVVADNGEIIYTVPAILNRNYVNPINETNINISQIISNSEMLSRIHPNQGEVYLYTSLDKRAMLLKNSVNNLDELNRWNNIFKRYGIKPIELKVNKETNDLSNNNDDMEFIDI